MPGSLDGIKVVDFGQYIAGPLTGMLLADQGAEVIRVDPPGGPLWETPANGVWNRGKRRVTLDLKAPEDLGVARRLIARADVVIENFRPGVMDRLGLGPAEMTSHSPRLVYCSLPGFATDDPRAGMPAWEGVVGAATATYRSRTGDGATYTAIPIASTFAALVAGIAITSALLSRERDGRGQRVEVPLFDAMFEAIGAHGMLINGQAAGERPNDFGGGILAGADGGWVQLSLAKPRFIERFVTGLNLTDRFDPERLRVDSALRQALMAELPEIIATRTADDWEAFGADVDIPLIRIRDTAEWMASRHARESGSVVHLDDPEVGPMWQPNSPVRLARTSIPSAPARELDADRASILEELSTASQTSPRAELPPERTAALEGVRVLDLSQVLAGPMGGRTLGELGADVVKVNPPNEEGAGIRMSVHRYHTDVNRAKRTILLDLKRPGAVDIVWRLIDDSDVVINNFRPGVLERLGLGYAEASRRKPGIIYVSVSAYGPGPWGGRPGYEPFGQASTGMSMRQGGDGRPTMQPFAVNDYGTGLSAALAAVFALFHRERTGQGQEGEASLAYTGLILQSPYAQLYEGKRWDEPRGPGARGVSPLQRLYEASDGWFFLGGKPSQLADLARVDGLDGVDGLAGATLEAELERRFVAAPRAAWQRSIAAVGLGIHEVTAVKDLMAAPWVIQHGLSVTRLHDTGEEITTVGPAARLSSTPATVGRPAATPGADGLAVLDRLGLIDAAERLASEGAFATANHPMAD